MLMYIKQEFVSKILQIIRIPPSHTPWVKSRTVSTCKGPLTLSTLKIILLTVCYTNLMILIWRIWYWIKQKSLYWYFSSFLSLVFLMLYGSILRRDSVLVTVMGVKGSKQLYHGLCPLFDTNRNFNFVNLKYTISSISFVAENVSLYLQMYGCSCKLREYKI